MCPLDRRSRICSGFGLFPGGFIGWCRVSRMLVCLGTVSGTERVVSLLRREQGPWTELATLLLPEPQRVQIRILHHEAQADRLGCQASQIITPVPRHDPADLISGDLGTLL